MQQDKSEPGPAIGFSKRDVQKTRPYSCRWRGGSGSGHARKLAVDGAAHGADSATYFSCAPLLCLAPPHASLEQYQPTPVVYPSLPVMSKESKDAKERHAPHDIATRVQALTLKVNGFSDKEILEQTGVASRTIRHIYSRARKRGFDPDVSKKIELKHIEDGKRTGRPRKDATATPKKPDAQQSDQQQEPPQGPPSASLEGQQPLPQLSPPHEQPDQQPQQQPQQQQHQPQQQPKYAPPPPPQHSPLYVQHQLMSFAAPSEHETGEPPQDVDMQEADLASRLREELTQPDSIPMDPAVVGDSAGRNEAMSVYPPPPPAPVP